MSDPTPTPAGTITFVQNHVPVLEAGDYTLTPTFTVNATQPDGTPVSATQAPARRFAVYGDRFTLDQTLVESVFPPPNSTGLLSNVLPHAVLTRRTLPWERTASADGNPKPDAAGDVAPWMALLLFDETEMARVVPSTVTVDALLPGGSLPSGAVSSLSVPLATLDDWESRTDACQVIDVPPDLFSAVAPTMDDLKWLAHARVKSVPGPAPADPWVTTDHAVVVGNRLPATGHTSTVFLVSLEQLEKHLPVDADGTPSPLLHGVPCVRLVVLSSWKFTAAPELESFAQYLEGLDHADADDDLLRLPVGTGGTDPADTVVTGALTRGYLPLAHTTREGDRTVSWYRGPLIPHEEPFTALDGALLPAASADGVTRYDPDDGMFDVSLAAAWQIGRLLALADRHFATELYAYKRERRQAAAKLVAGAPDSRPGLVSEVVHALARAAKAEL